METQRIIPLIVIVIISIFLVRRFYKSAIPDNPVSAITHSDSQQVLSLLYEKHHLWFRSQAGMVGTHLPRMLSGISKNGENFNVILDDDPRAKQLDHVERAKFVRVILQTEDAYAYAYSSLVSVKRPDNTNQIALDISTATCDQYLFGEWLVHTNSDGTRTLVESTKNSGKDPDESVGTSHLKGTRWVSVSPEEKEKYEALWHAIRPSAMFQLPGDRSESITLSAALGSKNNPVRCYQPVGEHEYLSRLRCADGTSPRYVRKGSVEKGPYGNPLDWYVLTSNKMDTDIYFDMYHHGFVEKSPVAPFSISRS